jgi:hypothetical protein
MVLISFVYEIKAGIAVAARMLAVAFAIIARISGVTMQTVATFCKRF